MKAIITPAHGQPRVLSGGTELSIRMKARRFAPCRIEVFSNTDYRAPATVIVL